MADLKLGQELEFYVYRTRIQGKFLSILNDKIEIEVIYDSSGVWEKGSIETINKSYLVNK